MLLNQVISYQQSCYTEIQLQIEALQERQREIQAYLQKLGSVESRMESAAQLLQQAIADINEVCPDELTQFKQTVLSLFNGHTTAFITPGSDTDPQSEVAPVAPTAPTNDVWESDGTVIETTAVVVDDSDYQDPEETLIEQKEDVSESQPELDFSALTWVQIKRLASSMGIDINRRKRPHLEKSLSDLGITQAEIEQFLKG